MNPSLYWIHSSRPFDLLVRMDGEYYRGLFWIGHWFGLYMDGLDAVHFSSLLEAGFRRGAFTVFTGRYGEDCLAGECDSFSLHLISAGVYRGDGLLWMGLGDGEDMRYWAGYRGKIWALNLDVKVYADRRLRKFHPVLSVFFLNVIGLDFPELISDTASIYSLLVGASSGFQYDSSRVALEYGRFPALRYRSTFSKPGGSFVEMDLYRGDRGNYIRLDGEVVGGGPVGAGLGAAGLFPLDFRDSLGSHQVYPFIFARYGELSIHGGYRISRSPYLSPYILWLEGHLSRGMLFSSFSLEAVSGGWRGCVGIRWRGMSLYYAYYMPGAKSFDRVARGHYVGFSFRMH